MIPTTPLKEHLCTKAFRMINNTIIQALSFSNHDTRIFKWTLLVLKSMLRLWKLRHLVALSVSFPMPPTAPNSELRNSSYGRNSKKKVFLSGAIDLHWCAIDCSLNQKRRKSIFHSAIDCLNPAIDF